MGGGGPVTPRNPPLFSMSGSSGGRQMPGIARSPFSGARDVYSGVTANDFGLIVNGLQPVSPKNNLATAAYQISTGVYLGSFPKAVFQGTQIGGIGGGPNEPGTNHSNWVQYGNSVYGVNDITVEGGLVSTNWSHYTTLEDRNSYVNKDSRFEEHGMPYFFDYNLNGSTHLEPAFTYSTGGGGWGAAGGSILSPGNLTYDNTTASGGAGGPAIKTNGNSVTWTGGQGTDRVFGAVA